jgi:hypothetical protein
VGSAHVGIARNEKADFDARQATLGNMVYNAQSVARDFLPVAKRECWTNDRKFGMSLKQEGFRTPSFPESLLDHGLRNGGRRET